MGHGSTTAMCSTSASHGVFPYRTAACCMLSNLSSLVTFISMCTYHPFVLSRKLLLWTDARMWPGTVKGCRALSPPKVSKGWTLIEKTRTTSLHPHPHSRGATIGLFEQLSYRCEMVHGLVTTSKPRFTCVSRLLRHLDFTRLEIC